MKYKPKRKGSGLEFKTFEGESGSVYTVLRTPKGAFHVLVETEATAAADDCGAKKGLTRHRWESLWKKQ